MEIRRFVARSLCVLIVALSLTTSVTPVGATIRQVQNCNNSGSNSLRDALGTAMAGDTITFSSTFPI